ncbi:MAG: hypothetical protein ABEI57_06705 [Halapricum sp.]
MDVLGDLVDPDRGDDALWIHRPGPRSRSWSGRQFCIDAWKTGNLLRHYGVHESSTVGVLDGPNEPGRSDAGTSPQALLALFGAWVLGADVQVDPPAGADVRALVGPTAWLEDVETPPGCKALGYGTPPEDPTIAHFEGERWSENPVKFPAETAPDDVALRTESGLFSHADLLSAGQKVVETHDLGPDDRIALSAPLSDPGTIVAGVVAPLLAGGTITLGGEATLTVADRDGENVIRPEMGRP